MPFKEGVEAADVHEFRAFVMAAKQQEEQIDLGVTTPKEAWEAVKKLLAFGAEPAKKKEKA